ncbi:hypothetical protein FDA94_00580 [Herbidospora galbida]|uniref:YCII-related domain-containing protein n=1 Tax=Herbidospora galbida TaxID=2575442 RepID=A0A4U3MSL8_9ACTN|nr:hypothetical protein [Herbidospora galbida]TKK91336.1 hypothetical protein FDA94_00580 [Herbidospora galbida]
MKYVLMFFETDSYVSEMRAKGATEQDVAYEAVGRWLAEHAEKITHQTRLKHPHTATTIRLDAIVDGPAGDGPETFSGYIEVEVADLDEALRLARSWPACPVVEIRPAT